MAEYDMTGRPGSARAKIIELRKANPTVEHWALYVVYDGDRRNHRVGWNYFQSVCREFDSLTEYSKRQ